MAELIVFPDVEDLVRRYLLAELPARIANVGVDVGQLPATLPDRHVFVRRTGGTSQGLVVDVAQITLEARALRAGAAAALAGMVRALLGRAERDGWLVEVPVYDVRELGAPYLDPDPVNPKHHRYSATYQVAVRGSTAA